MGDVGGDFKLSKGGPTARVDDTFLDLATVKGLLFLEEGGIGLDCVRWRGLWVRGRTTDRLTRVGG